MGKFRSCVIFSDGLMVLFAGAVGEVKSWVLRTRKATSVRHCRDWEKIS